MGFFDKILKSKNLHFLNTVSGLSPPENINLEQAATSELFNEELYFSYVYMGKDQQPLKVLFSLSSSVSSQQYLPHQVSS